MHAKDLFAGRKAHVGGHPGHNFSLPRVFKKIETWRSRGFKTSLPQILSTTVGLVVVRDHLLVI